MYEKEIQDMITYSQLVFDENMWENGKKISPNNKKFESFMISKWAVSEAIRDAMDAPFDDPFDTVEKTLLDFLRFSCVSDNERRKRAFATAVEAIEDMVNILTMNKPKGENYESGESGRKSSERYKKAFADHPNGSRNSEHVSGSNNCSNGYPKSS